MARTDDHGGGAIGMTIRATQLLAITAASVLCSAPAALAGGVQTYQATFDALWNATDHPNNFPLNAHFSPLVGASHGAAFDIWTSGEAASNPVELVAELGSSSQLIGVINSAVTAGTALERVSGSAPNSPGVSTTNVFDVSESHPYFSLITMVAPSHDWFVGLDSLDLRNGVGGFRDTIVIDLIVWDAGTEPGNDFSLAGSAEEGGVIHVLPNVESIFGGSAPIARLTINRLNALTGDLNADGIVDTADLGLLIGVFSTSSVAGDLNGDQTVDTADLGLLIANFGATAP